MMDKKHIHGLFQSWRDDWNRFARDVLKCKLDPEQEEILHAVQHNKMVSVASGTSRGKDYVSAAAALCFLYLTPKWDEAGRLVENTKVAMTAPTDRQVGNIMAPEVSRMFRAAGFLPGRLVSYDIRTDYEEWFLTGFKADDKKTEVWSGFHAVNTMFIVTEASGISQTTFDAIEGNLQGNSRILLVFNPNISTGYAAASHTSKRWKKFRLDSLTAPNVLQKKIVIPGQVDYEWVKDKVESWCQRLRKDDFKESEGDFYWEGEPYRPSDIFRIKVRGMFPKVGQDVLIPGEWIDLANKRWEEQQQRKRDIPNPLRLGVDIAGMGRDSSCFCLRFGPLVEAFHKYQSAGEADHMKMTGIMLNFLQGATKEAHGRYAQAFIDTIGEGAGVFSRAVELSNEVGKKWIKAFSSKFSESAEWAEKTLKDITDQFEFINMRAWLFWAVRDWLNPDNNTGAMLPPDDELKQEAMETKWWFTSNGKIQMEAKEDIKKRIGRSPDKFDSLALTFWPVPDIDPRINYNKKSKISNLFR